MTTDAVEHECVFVEEEEPSGRLILPPCIVCRTSAMDALGQLRRERDESDLQAAQWFERTQSAAKFEAERDEARAARDQAVALADLMREKAQAAKRGRTDLAAKVEAAVAMSDHEPTNRVWHEQMQRIRATLAVDSTPRPEGVGTGAGEGATGQDTGTAWVTRSTDCPEAPDQAHPLAPQPTTTPAWACLACRGEEAQFDAEWLTAPCDAHRASTPSEDRPPCRWSETRDRWETQAGEPCGHPHVAGVLTNSPSEDQP